MRTILSILLTTTFIYAAVPHIMTEDLKPYSYMEDGQMRGISVDVVQKIMQRLEIDTQIQLYPWSRALNLLKNDSNAILFSTAKTKERQEMFQFACPLTEVDVYFYTHKGFSHTLHSLEDAKSLNVGVIKDFAAHRRLEVEGFTNLDLTSNTLSLIQKLNEGRIDTFVAATFTIANLIDEGVDISSVKKSDLKFYTTPLCIAFNKDFDPKSVQQWEKELQKIHESGEYDKIYQQYIDKKQF